MLVVLFGASGAGKSSILRELEISESFPGEVSYSPIKDLIKKGLLPDPKLDKRELGYSENILEGVEEYLFQNGLVAFLYAIHRSLAKVFKGRSDKLLVMDRSFIDTLPYYRMRVGEPHPYEEILISRFLELTDLAIYVPPYPAHSPKYERNGISDAEEFGALYYHLLSGNSEKVVKLESPSLEGRVKEVLDILDKRR